MFRHRHLFKVLPIAISTLFFSRPTAAARPATARNTRVLPAQVYGVNIGGWLVLEPWMLPSEWASMGGQTCENCSNCIASEFALVRAYPSTADASFQKHWESWFTQDDVDDLVSAGLNTVRIPLGFWIIESLVDRSTEYYPTGGLVQLQRGMQMLNSAGVNVILDHHGLPGVQTADQSFTGHCTSDVQFYTDSNYQRALVWAAVMTSISHLDPAFSTVSTIEAANEPISDASQTPGYEIYLDNFVQVVRLVESALLEPFTSPLTAPLVSNGLIPNASEILSGLGSSILSEVPDEPTSSLTALDENDASWAGDRMHRADGASLGFVPSVAALQAIASAAPILTEVAKQLNLSLYLPLGGLPGSREREYVPNNQPLNTGFMDALWQYTGSPSNPADAADGPAAYDDHLYYSYGGVADATETAYLTSMCNLQRVQNDATLNNSPVYFGEWSLATQFAASDSFLSKWADAQKYAYNQGAGWIFWNFKLEQSDGTASLLPQWSYLDALERGIFTQDPSAYNDPNVCANYTTSS